MNRENANRQDLIRQDAKDAKIQTETSLRPWRLGVLIFIFLVILNLLPVWLFRYFPSQDGPSHVYNSWIISNWDRPEGGIFRHYYSLNTRPEPNWLSHAALAGLMRIGAPPIIAEKIFISVFIVLLACGMWYALGGIAKQARLLAALVLPLALGWPLGMGFYNYCLGLAGFLWVFGWWYRQVRSAECGMRNQIPQIAILAFFGVCLYFTHLVAVGGVMVAIFTVAVWESIGEGADGLRRRVLPVVIAFIPAVVLGIAFVIGSASQGRMGGTPLLMPGFWKLRPLLTLENILVCYTSFELIPATILSLTLIASTALILFKRKKAGGILETDALLAASIVFVILYFFAPHELAGGTYLFRRLAPLTVFMLILWLGSNRQHERVLFGLKAIGIAIAIVFAGMRTVQVARLNDYINEYISVGESIKTPATVLPLCLSPRGTDDEGRILSLEIWPFSHASGYLAAGRPIVDLSDYEGAMGYFPLLWRPEVSPFEQIGSEIFDEPLSLKFLDYERRTRGLGRIDYVLVWMNPKNPPPRDKLKPMEQQLAAGFKLIATSKPRGYARLYARMD